MQGRRGSSNSSFSGDGTRSGSRRRGRSRWGRGGERVGTLLRSVAQQSQPRHELALREDCSIALHNAIHICCTGCASEGVLGLAGLDLDGRLGLPSSDRARGKVRLLVSGCSKDLERQDGVRRMCVNLRDAAAGVHACDQGQVGMMVAVTVVASLVLRHLQLAWKVNVDARKIVKSPSGFVHFLLEPQLNHGATLLDIVICYFVG